MQQNTTQPLKIPLWEILGSMERCSSIYRALNQHKTCQTFYSGHCFLACHPHHFLHEARPSVSSRNCSQVMSGLLPARPAGKTRLTAHFLEKQERLANKPACYTMHTSPGSGRHRLEGEEDCSGGELSPGHCMRLRYLNSNASSLRLGSVL